MNLPLLSQPTLRGARLVFVADDDLWTVDLAHDSRPRRLTTGHTVAQHPLLSHDGRWVAYTASEEGLADLYVIAFDGGPTRRLTFLGGAPIARAFTLDDHRVVFTAARGQAFDRPTHLSSVPLAGGAPEPLNWGPATGYDEHRGGARLLVRHSDDLAHWKRYRGGRVGRVWVDPDGTGQFERLPSLGGNLACARWVDFQDELRLLFVSDHDGVANLYSCQPNGQRVVAHTHHTERAVRYPSHSGSRVVYEHAGHLWSLDLITGDNAQLALEVRPQQASAQRRHTGASRDLRSVALHPEGHALLLGIRGRPFFGGHWEGPLLQLGARQGVHHRLATFLADGLHALWSSDALGDEHLELGHLETLDVFPLELDQPLGRPQSLVPGPDGRIAVVNEANRIGLITLDEDDSDGLLRSASLQWLTEPSEGEAPSGLCWSPGGRYLAFAESVVRSRRKLRLIDLEDPSAPVLTDLTDGRYADRRPDFTPCGRYLVFVSTREFDPVQDQQRFGYSFPRGSRPYLLTLSAEARSPFEPEPQSMAKARPPKPVDSLTIDLDGITDRIVPFPLGEARYRRVVGLPSGRFLLHRDGINGSLNAPWKTGGPPPAKSQLLVWDPATREQSTVLRAFSGFTLDAKRTTLAARIGNRIRVFPADADKATRATLAKNDPFKASRQTFWVDVGRARVTIDPRAEWRQMFLEAWRLQRDHYWDGQHAGVDWEAVRQRYLPEVERVSTRAELSDLIGCMHGELATSHAYVIGGDHARHVVRNVGFLAADFTWEDRSWIVTRTYRGEPGRSGQSCPLLAPGIRAGVGTRILRVDGESPTPDRSVESFLVGHAGRPVRLDIQRADEEPTTVWVKPLSTDTRVRYRSWVEDNRTRVHEATAGRVGYVHVPDMGPGGFAQFHRDYLFEADRDALIVDVRYNRGGHVSQLLLATLMQRRLAYTVSRNHGASAYPAHSVAGPMVALTNAYAGSDGDIFSRNWKRLGLGPLIGTRTWGGVVGVRPSRRLVDDTLTTQPQFAFWFDDGDGFGVEGHGVEPDIEVVISPMDWAAGLDPQLDRAVAEIQAALVDAPPNPPVFGAPPTR